MKKQEILKLAQSNAERISAIEKHLFGEQPTESKQLEVGKWYKVLQNNWDNPLLARFSGEEEDCNYGFDFLGQWSDDLTLYHKHLGIDTFEATPQEIEEALIAEAKRRYNVGDKLSKVCDDFSRGPSIFSLNIEHQAGLCDLWIKKDGGTNYDSCIFKNGKWATVIEQDKFAELKEAHKNGAVIQYKHKGLPNWIDNPNPAWSDNYDYRVKPAYVPHPGDICKFWDDDETTLFVSANDPRTDDDIRKSYLERENQKLKNLK